MADLLSNIQQDKQQIKNQLGEIPEVVTIPKFYDDSITMLQLTSKVIEKQISGAMIWESPSFGIWGTSKWGNTSGSAFILNSAEFGVLGTNKLGSGGSSEALYAVLNPNNLFREYFSQDLYIDTVNSTGTLNTTTEQYELGISEIYQTEVIHKPRGTINQITFINNGGIDDESQGLILPFTLDLDTFGNDNAVVQVSNDGGSTWEDLQDINLTHTFASSSNDDELKIKVTANSAFNITPLSIQIN